MISNEDKKEIFRLFYEEGFSKSLIARRFNLDHTTVMYHLRKPGEVVQPRGKARSEEIVVGVSKPHYPRFRTKIDAPNEREQKSYRDILRDALSTEVIRDSVGNIIQVIKRQPVSELEIERRIRDFSHPIFSSSLENQVLDASAPILSDTAIEPSADIDPSSILGDSLL